MGYTRAIKWKLWYGAGDLSLWIIAQGKSGDLQNNTDYCHCPQLPTRTLWADTNVFYSTYAWESQNYRHENFKRKKNQMWGCMLTIAELRSRDRQGSLASRPVRNPASQTVYVWTTPEECHSRLTLMSTSTFTHTHLHMHGHTQSLITTENLFRSEQQLLSFGKIRT